MWRSCAPPAHGAEPDCTFTRSNRGLRARDMRAGHTVLGDDEILHMLTLVAPSARVQILRLVSRDLARLVNRVGIESLVLVDISANKPFWFPGGLVVCGGWLSKRGPNIPPRGLLDLRSEQSDVDPVFKHFAFLAPRVLTLGRLLSAVDRPHDNVRFAKRMLGVYPSVGDVYFASYCELSSCRDQTLGNGMHLPATRTYASVLSERRKWCPPASVMSELADDATPPDITLMIPAGEVGCRCGKPSEHKCQHVAHGMSCRKQCCATCFPLMRDMSLCGECGSVVCSGHAAICISCRTAFCVHSGLCLGRISDYCPQCHQPMCWGCLAGGAVCPCGHIDEYEDYEDSEDDYEDEED